MSGNHNNNEALSQSLEQLEELQKVTEDLDKELEDSEKLLLEIQSIFNAVPNGQQIDPELRREQLVSILGADGPRILMQGMAEVVDVDIEAILAGIRSYGEFVLKNILPPEPQQEPQTNGFH